MSQLRDAAHLKSATRPYGDGLCSQISTCCPLHCRTRQLQFSWATSSRDGQLLNLGNQQPALLNVVHRLQAVGAHPLPQLILV